MQKPVVAAAILALYTALLVRLLLFKTALIHVGPWKFKFAPQVGEPNYWPFSSIASYLRGEPSWLIAGFNLIGNVALLAPVGFLIPLVARRIGFHRSMALAVAAILALEAMQVALHVGIFDIDDVILNALGVMLGYGAFWALCRRPGARSATS